MRIFRCECSNNLFFENSHCLACAREVAWCPQCKDMEAIKPAGDHYHCAACASPLMKCHNYSVEGVCNRTVLKPDKLPAGQLLCDYCHYNDTIPDLSVERNRELWYRLEKAKRRLLYTLDLLALPHGTAANGFELPLSFDFKGDVKEHVRWWWKMGREERVYTGHASGKITINIREADEIEREKARVSFDEAHRTEIGHFRHEIGHYYWELLVQGECEASCKAVFGDHENPGYGEALQQHYVNGPPHNWKQHYISAYATMHPWEDFAETFAAYLDMVSVLDTALNMDAGTVDPCSAPFAEMVRAYIHTGVMLNEMNRAQGLIDLVPEILTPTVVGKLQFVHDLLRAVRD